MLAAQGAVLTWVHHIIEGARMQEDDHRRWFSCAGLENQMKSRRAVVGAKQFCLEALNDSVIGSDKLIVKRDEGGVEHGHFVGELETT